MTIDLHNRCFDLEDMGEVYAAYQQHVNGNNTEWHKVCGCFLRLPDWYDHSLDSGSSEYLEQQHRLWRAITGIERDYVPEIDEQCHGHPHTNIVRFPAGYIDRFDGAIERISHHTIAAGMIMKHCGLNAGQWALEYGAGFGNAALQLARMGVNVDTVDISDFFCDAVKQQADFYGVSLTPFKGEFGLNPRGDQKYDLIFFYEAFHHCVDFEKVISQLKQHLSPTGRIMLLAEPVIQQKNADIPFDWGFRLSAENLSIMRYRGWFELGFTEDFLMQTFTRAGFVIERLHCPITHCGDGYIIKHRPNDIELGTNWLPFHENNTWHVMEQEGRWTTSESHMSLDATDTFSCLVLEITNHHPAPQPLTIEYGSFVLNTVLRRGKNMIMIDATNKAPKIVFKTSPVTPSVSYGTPDTRALGVYVNTITYI